jgi:hypothetical protein
MTPNEEDATLWQELQSLVVQQKNAEHGYDPQSSAWRLTQPRCPGSGKYSFRNRKLALTRLNELRRKGAAVTQVYQCPTCNKWHLTSRSQAPHSEKTES